MVWSGQPVPPQTGVEHVPADPPPRPTARRRLLEIAQTIGLTLLLFIGIQTFVAQPYQVNLHSMQQTLEPGEYVLVDKLSPRFGTYAPGEIIVFAAPAGWAGDDGTPFIKRVIAVGGQTLEIRDGLVYVDGEAIDEPYLFSVDGVVEPTRAASQPARWVVPPGELFVMGDHRSSSSDSRSFGPIPIDSVIGRAWLRYWPLDRFGVLESAGGDAG
jgi:signal peptidase I